MSRYSLREEVEENVDNDTYLNFVLSNKDLPIDFEMIRNETKDNKSLQEVIKAIANDKFNSLKMYLKFLSRNKTSYQEVDTLIKKF